MKNLIIIGASGFGREVAWLVERINKVQPTWNIKGFIDDNESLIGTSINGYDVLCSTKDIVRYKDSYFVCAVGSSKIRKQIVDRLSGFQFATLIDPSVEMSDLVEIGEGSIICAHSILTVNIKLGKHNIINLDCTIGHDAIFGDFVTLYPSVNASGTTTYGDCVELGTGSQIIQGKNVGKGTIVGAGSVVVKDLPEECTAVGAPCRPIKFHNEASNE